MSGDGCRFYPVTDRSCAGRLTPALLIHAVNVNCSGKGSIRLPRCRFPVDDIADSDFNIFLDLTGARSVSVIGIVIFTLIAGIALLKVKKEGASGRRSEISASSAIQIWVAEDGTYRCALTPYGVMALMTTVFSSYHFEQFASLLGFIGACYIAIFMMFYHCAIAADHSAVIISARYSRMVWPVLTFAFVSRSSSAASIPLAISASGKNLAYKAPLPIFPPRWLQYGREIAARDLSGYYK